jgi:hypothetical protein
MARATPIYMQGHHPARKTSRLSLGADFMCKRWRKSAVSPFYRNAASQRSSATNVNGSSSEDPLTFAVPEVRDKVQGGRRQSGQPLSHSPSVAFRIAPAKRQFVDTRRRRRISMRVRWDWTSFGLSFRSNSKLRLAVRAALGLAARA